MSDNIILTSKSCDYKTYEEANTELNKLYGHVKEQGYVIRNIQLTYDKWDEVYHMSISWTEQ